MVRFWDTSALVPLVLEEPNSSKVRALIKQDPHVIAWWGTPVECFSALWRTQKNKLFDPGQVETLRKSFEELIAEMDLVSPSKLLKDRALRLLPIHSLRAADAFQLAAALRWCHDETRGVSFVCFDDRLRLAASAEGFLVLP